MKKILTKALCLVLAFVFAVSSMAFALPTAVPEGDLEEAVVQEVVPVVAANLELEQAIATLLEEGFIATAAADVIDLPWMGVNLRIHNGTGNLVIEGNSGTTAVNGTIDLWTYWADSTYYQWRLIPDENHEYVQFRRYTTSLAATALAPTGGTVANGTRLTLATASATADNQWFKPELQSTGRYVFSCKADPNLIIQPISAASGQGIRLATRPATLAASDTWRILTNPAGATLAVVKPIATIEALPGIAVPLNTPVGGLVLPASALVTYVDNTQATRAITWNTAAYNGETAGTYVLSGTIALDGMETNPNNVQASVAVEVGEGGVVVPVLTSIAVTAQPTKTAYKQGETLDLAGLVVTATYSDESTKAVTDYTTTPAAGAALSSAGTQTVTVRFSEGGIERTTTFTVTVEAVGSPTQPSIAEIRIIMNNMIEIHWNTPTETPSSSQYYRFSDNHPDTLTGAGSSLNFHSAQNTHAQNFEVRLNGAVLAQRTGTFSPYYWHAVNYNLHQVRMFQHVSTLRLNTALTTSQMAALESGASKLTVQVIGNVTNRAGEAADKTIVHEAIWKPYYDKQVVAKTGLTIKGSQYVNMITVQKAADMTDIIMASMPEAVVRMISSQGAFLLFGPGEHSGNIPEQRNVITYDQFNRAEGYGGANAATSAANVERCNVSGSGNTAPYYPTGYRSGYQHESILAHEFGHKIQTAFNSVYASTHALRQEFNACFSNVTSRVMWTPYIRDASGGSEYIATMTAVWYNGMSEGNAANCNTREEFFRYDRKGYDYFSKLFSHDILVLSPDWSNCPNTASPNWNTGSAEPFATLVTRNLSHTAPLPAVAVPVGTAVSTIALPAKVQVAYADSFSVSPLSWTADFGIDRLPVVWDTSAYNGEVAGTYEITGTIDPVYMGQYRTAAIANPNNVKASVTVTVEALVPDLASIAVTTPPTKTTYKQGEELDLTGLVVTATYSDETTKAVTGYATAPAAGAVLDTAGTQTVTVTYAEEGIEKTTTFTVTVEAVASPTQPSIAEIRIIMNNMIEIHWNTPTATPNTSQYYRYSDNHPDTLVGAGSSLNFSASQNTHMQNFEIRLNGTVLAQRTGTFSPYYWHAVNYNLHQVRMFQHVSTLRLNTALTTSQMAALESGASKLTVQVIGNVTNRAGEAADKTIVHEAIWKPYYDKQVIAKTGLTIKGSQYVNMITVQKAADMTDVIMASMPEAVVRMISSQGAFLLFGPGEHSGNIPEQRNVITYDQFNRAEGYGGTNAATSAANVERCNVSGSGNTAPYYPTGYRSGYQHESILAHEFGHKINSAFNAVFASSHPLRQEVTNAFSLVRSRNMWTAYVRDATSGGEYWATMTAVWYNGMSEGNAANCNTRHEFFRYDRKGYDFFGKIFSHDKLILSPDWSNCPNTAAPNYNTGSAEPFENVIPRNLSVIAPQAAITVPHGTAISAIELPASVQVAYTDSFSVSPLSWTADFGIDRLPVVWDTSAYNGEIAGTYTILGTPRAIYMGLYETTILANPDNLRASITVTVEPPPVLPEIDEVRIITNGMIELHWKTPTETPNTSQYYRYSDGHPDTLIGAGSSLNFSSTQNTHSRNFEIRLDGVVLAQRTGTFSPYYWHAVNYNLHQVRMFQHVSTLRLNSNLTASQMAALENGTSKITVQIVGDVTNRIGNAADKTIVYDAIWKPYYDKQVIAKTGLTIKGSQYVNMITVQKAADMTDVIMASMPEAVVRMISSQGAFLLFGPGEHSGNIPEQRNVITYDQFNRAEGYGGTNAATSAANVERCNVSGSGNTAPYYPAGYRSGYQHESILAHEFGHKIHSAFNSVFASTHPLRQEVTNAFALVRSRNMWTAYVRDTASGGEYWATMASVWYNGMSEGNAASCNTRHEFFRYDRKGYDFFGKIFSHDKLVLSPDWSNCPNTAAPNYNTGSAEPFENVILRNMSEIAPQAAITVPYGTALEEIELPANVQVAYTDSFSVSPLSWTADFGIDRLPVVWDTSAYNGVVAGTYTVLGTPRAIYMGLYETDILANPDGLRATIAITVEPCPHDYETVVTPPTCTAQGYTTHTCSICGDSYQTNKKSALGHNWDSGTVTLAPTYDTDGVLTYACRRCTDTYTEVLTRLSVPDWEVLQAAAAGILKNGLTANQLKQVGKSVVLTISGRVIVLSTNANNLNISGTVSLGGGHSLVFDLKGNGSNIKTFKVT